MGCYGGETGTSMFVGNIETLLLPSFTRHPQRLSEYRQGITTKLNISAEAIPVSITNTFYSLAGKPLSGSGMAPMFFGG